MLILKKKIMLKIFLLKFYFINDNDYLKEVKKYRKEMKVLAQALFHSRYIATAQMIIFEKEK